MKRKKCDKDRQYIIMPHCREPDASCSIRRFNCAGFVIEAYRNAGIDLVTTRVEALPDVPLQILLQAYPAFAKILQNIDHRKNQWKGVRTLASLVGRICSQRIESFGRRNTQWSIPAEGR